MRFHKDSQFGPGPRHALDREQRAVWRARVNFARRAGRITALHEQVGQALLRRLGEDGQLDPSHETIARDAGCSPSTVLRCLKRLADCGLVRWVRRLVRGCDWRCEQTSNQYVLVCGTSWQLPACDRQAAGVTRKDRFNFAREGKGEELAALLADAARLPDLLKARRRAWAAQAAGR